MSEHAIGNIFIRDGELLNEGDIVQTHGHKFDHVTFINNGAARIEKLRIVKESYDVKDVNGMLTTIPAEFEVEKSIEKKAYEKYNYVLIEKGVWHRITALLPNTIYHCIYSHRRPDTEEVVEEWTGWMDATH